MLLRIVDSFTPLDRIPVELSQKIIAQFKLPPEKNCSEIGKVSYMRHMEDTLLHMPQ
jgi:hypothetical protein